MERIIFVDTETTGLPKFANISAIDKQDNWPDIVSIAWIIYENGILISSKYSVIKPQWPIPEDSIKIHKITEQYAHQNGHKLYDVLNDLANDLIITDRVVAHNIEFDKNVLFNAYRWRLDINPWHFWPKDETCTMEKARGELKLPSKYSTSRYKSPSLTELYRHTFKKEPVDMHNSKNDVAALADIYWARWY